MSPPRKFVAAVLAGLLVSCAPKHDSTVASYQPLFSANAAKSMGLVGGSYAKAASSTSAKEAIERWQGFLAEYANGEPGDLTELTLVRQAHFELARLYYLSGRTSEADQLIRKADEYTVEATPSR